MELQYTIINPETKVILGGIDSSSSGETFHLQVSGGISTKNKHINKHVFIGDKSKTYVKNKIIEWDSFKEVYYEKGKLDVKYYKNLLETANDILPLPIHTTNYDNFIYMANKLYNSDSDKISKALINTYDIYDPFNQSIRFLFMSYKVYIENIIEIFVKLYNSHVNPSDMMNFNELIEKWTFIDLKNNTETSSIILFFNFPPHGLNLDSSIPTIKWEINNTKHSQKYEAYNKLMKKFLSSVKTNKFQYMGFCSHVAIKRLMELFKFPMSQLLGAIYELDKITETPTKLKVQLSKKCDCIIKNINKLQKNISLIRKPVKLQHNKKLPMEKTHNIESQVKILEKYINLYLTLYEKTLPEISKRELLIGEVSQCLSKISQSIQNITKIKKSRN